MKGIYICASIFCAVWLLFVLLTTSIEIAVYADMGYFQREYKKYNVLEKVHMQEEDLLFVTEQMMSYLKGNRQDLSIETIIDGEKKEFFNEKEKAHMQDVKALFLKAQLFRKIGIVICLLITGFMVWKKEKMLLLQTIRASMLCLVLVTAVTAFVISTNFNQYFTLFHKIFFSNDLWLLDPQTDRLINIVPEPFFIDTSIRIGWIFGGMVIAICILCSVLLKAGKKKTGV